MSAACDSPLEVAKERIRIPDLWQALGLEGEPKKHCRCPFHHDRSPSFSIFDDGRAWKCHAGCGEGSVVDFLAKAKGLSDAEACQEILKREGVIAQFARIPRDEKHGEDAKESVNLELPPLMFYSKELAQRVANSRGLLIAAVEFACLWMKTVVFARIRDQECWILTDASCRCAEARRIDREPFPAIGPLAERKSHSLRGSSKSWPVGILPPGFEEPWLQKHVHKILLVEGGPDYLAACQLIAAQDENVLPVALLGASTTICQGALSYFTKRDVTVVGHPDEAGRVAAIQWAQQIKAAGGLVRSIQLKKGDLCDIVSAGATHNDLRLF